MIDFKNQLPDTDQYFELFKTTGWNEKYKFEKQELQKALNASWYAVSVYDDEKLIGFGRIISDGVHHALIVDLIVDPHYQGRGFGSLLLEKLVDHCKSHNIRDVQLFSAKDKYNFYEKFGFTKRPADAPGMQLK